MPKRKYETHVLPYLEKIAAWTEAGATVKEIAGKLKIAYSSLRKYLDAGDRGDERYAALSAAFARAREKPDDEVEAALYKRACGITYDEAVYETKYDSEKDAYLEVCVRRVRKYIPPDPTSAMFWLTNRRPEAWRYHPEEAKTQADAAGGVVLLAPIMDAPADAQSVDQKGASRQNGTAEKTAMQQPAERSGAE